MSEPTTYLTTVEDVDGVERQVEVKGYWVPFMPAKLYGPPEDCYPAEGGYLEDVEIFVDGDRLDDAVAAESEWLEVLTEAEQHILEESQEPNW